MDRFPEQICWEYQVIFRLGKSVLVKSVLLLSVIGLGPPSLAQSDSLGRLFFTPRERASMNSFRNGTPLEAQPVAPTVPNRVDGFVERSNGKNTIWINGQPTSGSSSNLNSKLVDTPARIVVRRTGNNSKRIP
jgi:hypothetical protein